MENQQDESQVLETETTEQAPEQIAEVATAEPVEEDIEALKAKAAKVDELEKKNKQLFERAKKAEAIKPEPTGDFSAKDVLALTEHGVTSKDYDEVVRVAKILGKPVSEALSDPTLKIILDTRKEERTTASATQTRGARGGAKVSGEDLLARALTTGELPETDEGMAALAAARLGRKPKN